MPTNDVYRLRLVGEVVGQFCENCLHFISDEAGAINPLLVAIELVDVVMTVNVFEYLACLPDNYELSGLHCKRVNNGGGPEGFRPGNAAPGTRPGAAPISSVGPCIIFPYSAGGRWRSGRMFFPGAAGGDVIRNTFTPPLVNACEAFGINLRLPVLVFGHTFQFAIYSVASDVAHVPAGFTISAKIGQQNGRLKPVL